MTTSREDFKPGTLIYPLPAVLVSCGETEEEKNLLTVAWTGTICSDPAMCYISVRKERHSHAILKRTGEFVINLTTRALCRATDWCGVRSGRDYDKFKEMNLTPLWAKHVKAPLVAESPVAIECRVMQVREQGTHEMFISEVELIEVDPQNLNPETGKFELERADLVAYSHGEYYTLGEKIGTFGYSVRKKRAKSQERRGKR